MKLKAFPAALAVLLGAAAVPASAQQLGSSGFEFLQAVEQRDGGKATQVLQGQASVINARGDNGDGALHIVARRRDSEWLRFMLSKGADANLANRTGDTALHIAARSGWLEGLDLLLLVKARVDAANRLGETPLIIAVQQKQLPTVRRLLEAGANPDKTDNASGRSARDYARLDTRSADMLRVIDQTKARKPAAVAGPKL